MTMRPRLYIAGPLSGTPEERDHNVSRAIEAGRKAIELGWSPLIPHLTNFVDPTDSLGVEVWYAVDRSWVVVSHAVLRLEGASVGADDECALAGEHKIPVALTWMALAEIKAEMDKDFDAWEAECT